MIRRRALAVAGLLALAALGAGCSRATTVGPDGEPAGSSRPAPVAADDERLRWFEEHFGKRVLLSASADLDADGRDDLVVIYRVGERKNAMRVVLARADGYRATNDVPAPVENQRISFRDVDDTPPTEITVQGSKGPKIGYAVFRIEDGILVNLFGRGMDDCC